MWTLFEQHFYCEKLTKIHPTKKNEEFEKKRAGSKKF